MPDKNLIWDYLNLLGVGTTKRGGGTWSDADPTVPFDNEFYLLGLDESASDAEVAAQAQAAAQSAAKNVYDRGQAHHNRRIDISIRDQINQSGGRFAGNPAAVSEHRKFLTARRGKRLNEIAKALNSSDNWSAEQGTSMLKSIGTAIGVTPDHLDKTVATALQSAGQWSAPSAQKAAAQPRPTASQGFPLWAVIPPIGIVIGVIDPRAGIAFGVALALVALAKWNAERSPADMRLGVLNVVVAVVFGVMLLIRPGANAADNARWAGEWATDWGVMTLTPTSRGFDAAYKSATVEGTITLSRSGDGQLEGTWCRNACEPPNDSGLFRLRISGDGQSLQGWYSNGDAPIVTDDPNYALRGRRGSP